MIRRLGSEYHERLKGGGERKSGGEEKPKRFRKTAVELILNQSTTALMIVKRKTRTNINPPLKMI